MTVGNGLKKSLVSIVLLLVMVIIGSTAPHSEPSPSSLSPREALETLRERLEIQEKNRIKNIYLRDGREEKCPQFTSFIFSVGSRFRWIIPTFSVNGVVISSRNGYQAKMSREFIFSNASCKYTIAVKRHMVTDAMKHEVAPKLTDIPELLAQLKADSAIQPANPNIRGSINTDKKITMTREDANNSGYLQLGINYGAAEPPIDFSGIAFFGPHNFSLYLGNVPDDVQADAKGVADTRSYNLSVGNSNASMDFTLAKEVLLDGIWIKVFGD